MTQSVAELFKYSFRFTAGRNMYDIEVHPSQLIITHFCTRTETTCDRTIYQLFGDLTQFKNTICAAKNCVKDDPRLARKLMNDMLEGYEHGIAIVNRTKEVEYIIERYRV